MQLCAQWWLVITRPSGDTNDPEQPPASLTEESCASPSHFDSGLKPYFFATFALGKLSNVHLPSSASAARGTAAASKKAASRFMSAPESAARAAHIPCSDRALCLQGRAPSRVLTYATPPHFPEAGFLAMVARTLPRCACPVAWLRLSSAVHSSTREDPRMRFASQVSLAAVLLIGTAVMAQDIQPYQAPPRTGFDSTYQRHFGFYIRPDLGFGYLTQTESGVTISGLSGLAGVAIGGAIRENSILAVHIIDAVAQNPNVSSGGLSATANDTTVTMWGIGPQYTYYFMP